MLTSEAIFSLVRLFLKNRLKRSLWDRQRFLVFAMGIAITNCKDRSAMSVREGHVRTQQTRKISSSQTDVGGTLSMAGKPRMRFRKNSEQISMIFHSLVFRKKSRKTTQNTKDSLPLSTPRQTLENREKLPKTLETPRNFLG